MFRRIPFPAFLFAASLALSLPAAGQEGSGNADALLRGWEWWKRLSETARVQLAPKLVEVVGKTGGGASLAIDAADNTSRYRALCAREKGAFRETALCKGLQYRFGERSDWSRVILALHRRVGVSSSPARDAAAILAGLRQELGLAAKRLSGAPQHVLRGLYDEFGRCAPPACNPGLREGSELRALLIAAAEFGLRHGNDAEVASARRLMGLGWKAGA